ncbi:hypothetical protein [Agrobacterium vitis]|uniref:hypothetical protein n=1 Tax=Agrobacterium vitis TaxID=373 RepID=UPI001571BA91|nr:hypothetical protein [Agrobacterium vitis]NSZ17992.1 hypothetical protein [Agrobacterium vitis]QZO03740.1 hypothetical protein K4831_15255 [Agrobacterium vitis]UJL88866.1 hypothetical protein AVF2S5_13600 [Agrobacterium vitis]
MLVPVPELFPVLLPGVAGAVVVLPVPPVPPVEELVPGVDVVLPLLELLSSPQEARSPRRATTGTIFFSMCILLLCSARFEVRELLNQENAADLRRKDGMSATFSWFGMALSRPLYRLSTLLAQDCSSKREPVLRP